MKKTIIIEILLLFALSVSIYFSYYHWNSVKNLKEMLELCYRVDYDISTIQWTKDSLKIATTNGILTLILSLSIFVTLIITAIKDFPCFKPLIEKYQAKVHARKAARTQAKTEKAEAYKQAKIKALEEQLEELKKDGE